MARLDFLIFGALILLVGGFIAVEAFLSGGLLGSLGLVGLALPSVVFLVLGVAVIKVGMRPKELPETDSSQQDP